LAGGNSINDWYENELSDRGRFSFNALLKVNGKTANHLEWNGVDKQMQGELKGHKIWQWRIVGDVPYRVLGVFAGLKRAVFLMGYYHKGGVYKPPNALTTALERKKLLDQGACKLNGRTADDNL